jgi:hypothetical protein
MSRTRHVPAGCTKDEGRTVKLDGFDADRWMKGTGREELDEDHHGCEQLNVGVVQVHLDENGSCSLIDPLRSMQCRQVASYVFETATKLVDIA